MKIVKVLSILLVFFLLLLSTIVWAQDISSALEDIRIRVQEASCIILLVIQGVVIAFAILMLILAGLKWMSSDDPTTRTEAKDLIMHVLIGTFLVLFAIQIVNVILSGLGLTTVDCAGVTEPTELIDRINIVICILITIFQYVFAVIAAILVMFAGFKWMTSEDPAQRQSAKSLLMGVVIGIIIIVVAGALLNAVFEKSFGCADLTIPELSGIIGPAQGALCRIFRLLEAVAGVIATLVIMTSGITYFTSEDPERKSGAKGMVISAVLGLILVIISLQLVNSVITGMNLGDFDFECAGIAAPTFSDNIKNTICVLIRIVEAIIGMAVAVILAYSAIQFASSEDPELRAGAKNRAAYAIIGLIVVLVAMQLINAILTGMGVDTFTCAAISAPAAALAEDVNVAICVLLRILQAVAGVIAALLLIYFGLQWMTSDDPGRRTEAKNRAANTIIGLIIVLLAIQIVGAVMGAIDASTLSCPNLEDVLEDCSPLDKDACEAKSYCTWVGTTTSTTTTIL